MPTKVIERQLLDSLHRGAAKKFSPSGKRTWDDRVIFAHATRKPSGRRAIRINMPSTPFRLTTASADADPTGASIRVSSSNDETVTRAIPKTFFSRPNCRKEHRKGWFRTTPPQPILRSAMTIGAICSFHEGDASEIPRPFGSVRNCPYGCLKCLGRVWFGTTPKPKNIPWMISGRVASQKGNISTIDPRRERD